ncbi:MAG: AraC family transcriptional regulator [Eubacteriales bacterium]|jgi:AraC-like DNA-binding protein|nr:AraC family transcriptional regulator [Eubacteriales bacterium]
MIENEPGVLYDSKIYPHVPSEFARKNLFYAHVGGSYHCTPPYRVQRDYLESYIIFLITDGLFAVDYRDEQLEARPGQIVLLDCKYPQAYWMVKTGRFKWFHFSGNASQAYLDLVYSSRGIVIDVAEPERISQKIDAILQMMAQDLVDEHHTSSLVHQIFAEVLSPQGETDRIPDPVIRNAILFIDSHFNESITLEQIAASVNLSPYYFLRLFKKYMDSTPHEYLTQARLKHAMRLLKQSRQSLDSIADQCGFNSATHFIRSFRQRLSMTPGQYRQLKF